MARWIIFREDEENQGVKLFYLNLVTGMKYNLGTVDKKIDDLAILDWIFERGEPAIGDFITLSTGKTFRYQQTEAAA